MWIRLIALLLCAAPAVAADPKRPNVLFIIADDLRPQLGCYGDKHVQSPHLDAFAKRAVRFDRAYVQCAICSPSRNSFLSGLRPNTTGLRAFGTMLREVAPDVVTLPQQFKNNGYHTAAVGKVFHVYAETGMGSEDDPKSWSVPLVYPKTPVWGPVQEKDRLARVAEAKAKGTVFAHSKDVPRGETWDAPDVPDDDLQDGEIAATAVTRLKEYAKTPDKPFFLAVGFLKPHLPFVAPKRYWDLYDPAKLPLPENTRPPKDAPANTLNAGIVSNYHAFPPPAHIDDAFRRKYLHAYLACVSYADACAGRVLAALDELKLADNTVIVVIGDHGYHMGEMGSWGHKHSNYEIATRAPLLIAAPGRKGNGQGTTSLAEFLDIYPTLAELAGLPKPKHAEGVSLVPVLDDPKKSVRDSAVSEMQRGQRLGRAIRTDRFRYVEWTDPAGKVVGRELYDHRTDPDETKNIATATDQTKTIESLSGELAKIAPWKAPVPKK
jgi:arylsulfatase A-like enzyme